MWQKVNFVGHWVRIKLAVKGLHREHFSTVGYGSKKKYGCKVLILFFPIKIFKFILKDLYVHG